LPNGTLPTTASKKLSGSGVSSKPLANIGRIRIELFRDAGRDGIQFDAGPPAAGQQRLRHQAEEMADAHRGFKNLRALAPKPKRCMACQMASITISGEVKCAFGVEARAESYSF
jgi:hypothetical protein